MEEELTFAKGSFQNLNNFVNLIKSFISKDMDFVIAITGAKGVGKSTLAMQIAIRYLNLIGKKFDVDRNVAYTFDQIVQAIENLEQGDVLIIDEAVNVMMAEDWAKFESKYLKKVFAKLRVKHLVVFLCIPNFFWLDRKYRDDMVNLWIHVFQRGKAFIATPSRNPGIDDAWFRKWLVKNLNFHFSDFSPVDGFETKVMKYPCFLDFITFNKLPDEIYAPYLEKRRQAIIEMEQLKKDISRKVSLGEIVTAWKLKEEKNLSMEKIATILGYHEKTIQRWFDEIKATLPKDLIIEDK